MHRLCFGDNLTSPERVSSTIKQSFIVLVDGMPGVTDIQMVTKYSFIIFDSCKHEHFGIVPRWLSIRDKSEKDDKLVLFFNDSKFKWDLAAACPERNVCSPTGLRPRDAKVRWGGGVAADVCVDVEEIVDGEVS